MKKLSNITESVWGKILDRGAGETIRKEDEFNPDYVDFGENTTVYWAIDNLEIDGDVKFYFDDVKDYNNNGWRLPTVDEVNQLQWNIRIAWYDGCKHLKFYDGNELRLKTNGSGGFHMWTKEINTKFPSSAYAYGFNNSHDFDVTNFNKSINRLFVFLVKDKKVNESVWGKILDRGVGETIRKEDDVNLMDKDTLYDYIMSTYGDMCIRVNNLDEYILVRIARGYVLSLHYKNNKIDEILSDGFDFGDSSEFDTKFKMVKEKKSLYKIFNLDGTVTNKTALDFIGFYYKNVIGDKEFDLLKELIKEFVNSSDEYSLDSFCDYIKTKKNLTVDNIMGRLIYFIKNNEDFYSDEINKVTKDINESIWGKILDRGTGEIIRKEDDINHLDIYEFCEYLRNTYISKQPNRDVIGSMDNTIFIPFFEKDRFIMYTLWIEFNNNKIESISLPDVTKYNGIEDVFNLKDYSGDERRICVCPKDGSEITNSFAVKMIDYLLDQAVDDKYRMFIKKERS